MSNVKNIFWSKKATMKLAIFIGYNESRDLQQTSEDNALKWPW